jgi:hypothetical protein
MGKIKDLRGQRFGRLTVPRDAKPEMRDGHAYWPVFCDCPRPPKWVRGSKLLDGSTVSCGCERADPEVRRLARSGPGPEDHYDEGLDALKAFCEPDGPPEYDPDAAASGTPAAAAVRREAPPEPSFDALDEALFGTPVRRAAAPPEPMDDLDRAIYGDSGEADAPGKVRPELPDDF